jgi:hypothetical protein
VVITVEGDGHLGPIKEDGGRELYGEDLSMFPLVLSCGEARRGSSVYHETVMNLEKPLVLVISLRILLLVIFLDV